MSRSFDDSYAAPGEFDPEHGGALKAAAEFYGIPEDQWLDLSTGINSSSWPVPDIPVQVWQRLPEVSNSLHQAAASYYGASCLVPCAGSQQGISTLPVLYESLQKNSAKKQASVWVTAGSYNEHGKAWADHGHRVRQVACQDISRLLRQQPVDILILVNPDNPSGFRWSPEQLLKWWETLHRRDGWLIVDEAFMDATPEHSLCSELPKPGLFVLRSLGKFFGLAGVRSGFVFSDNDNCRRLEHLMGPWSVSHPAQFITEHALRDESWITEQKQLLAYQSQRLAALIEKTFSRRCDGTDLFQTIYHPQAKRITEALARQGVLVRYLKPGSQSVAGIRFGLPPADNESWQKLADALNSVSC